MKICILGNGLVSLMLAKALVNKSIMVDLFYIKKKVKYSLTRTLGISKSNIEFFNKNILNITKILWKIKKIRIDTENLHNKEILNFSNDNSHLFSILQNHQLYKILKKELKKNKFLNYKKNINYDKLNTTDYKLVINCDINSEITKKFFSNKLEKKYNSFAYTTAIDHKNLPINDTAVQIFTKKGPIAFLPVSNTQTSVVCYLRDSNNKKKIDIDNLIKKFNPQYKITKINEISKHELKSSNLRKYYKNNILAFGDLLHMLHPLAGQGFNMSIRDIKELTILIDKRVNLGLDIDSSICLDFENKTKDKNYIFSMGVDFVYEFFNLESKIKSNFLSKSINLIGKNRSFKNFLKKIADTGLRT